MAITLNIVKNSDAYTNMRIFRALTLAAVYSSAAIADVAIAASYVDATAAVNQVYYYGVELYNATDKTQFPALKAVTVADYGPLTGIVQNNIANYFSPVQQGDPNLGLVYRATSAQLSTIPGMTNTKAKFEDISLQATGTLRTQTFADAAMNVVLLDGKMVVIPSTPNYNWNAAVTAAVVNTDVPKIRDYLANNPDKAFFDLGGYRWKIKFMTKEILQKYNDIVLPVTAGVVRRTAQMLGLPNNAGQDCVLVEATGTPIAASNTSGLAFPAIIDAYGKTVTFYFEYVGPTPAP